MHDPQQKKDMKAGGEAHEKDQDAVENHSPLEEELGLNLEVNPPQREAVKDATTLAAPIIIPVQIMVSLGPRVLILMI